MKVKGAASWDPSSWASFWINQASRLLMRRFEQRLRPLGFGMAYLPVLVALEKNEGLLQRELAQHAHVEQPTIAALLARMERDGLISREPHPDDLRAQQIAITARARARLPDAKSRLTEVAEVVTLGFSKQERETFLSLLRRAVANLEAADEREG